MLSAHWSSDEARWLQRSENFMSAVKQGKFSNTLITYHPGVMTMRINEPIPLSRFSIDPPTGSTVFDMRSRETYKEDN